MKIEGLIFKPGIMNRNGRRFDEHCKISYTKSVPLTLVNEDGWPKKTIGHTEIEENEDGAIYVRNGIIEDDEARKALLELTHFGFHAGQVSTNENGIITSMKIINVSLLPENKAAMPDCVIERVEDTK